MGTKGRRVAAAACVVAFLLTACTLRSLDYLDYLAGGADASPDGSSDDAGDAGAGDAGAGDATKDADARAAIASDADADATAVEASGDASDASKADADAGTWCQRQQPPPAFCMDFDEQPQPLQKAYVSGMLDSISPPYQDLPGTTASVGMPASSQPGAFQSGTDALDAGNVRSEYEQPFALPSPVTTVTLQFDMIVVTFSAAHELDLVLMYLPNPDGGAAFRTYMAIFSGQGELTTDDPSGTGGSFPFPADGNWHTYRLDLSLASSLTFSLHIDGAQSGQPVTVAKAPFSSVAGASFFLGTDVYGPSGAVQVAIDNVVFEGQ